LLLFGFLEELHELQASAVEKVANDLREEIAVVAAEPGDRIAPAAATGNSDALSQIATRLAVLEGNVQRHSRVIKRAIEIAASYFHSERP
jgi:hypothetical protein